MYQETFDLSLDRARLHLSEAPFTMHQKILDVIIKELSNSNLYPEPGSGAATHALAQYWGVCPSKVVISNGCDESILNTFLKLGISGSTIVSSNSYPGYIEIAELAGQHIKEVPLHQFQQDAWRMIDAIELDTKLAILCNPHNPTGSLLSIADLDEFIKACNKKNVIPIIDEAYIDYSHEGSSLVPYIDRYEKVIIWKSFSKSHGLAGIRLGAAVGTPSLIAKLKEASLCNPFSVNRISQCILLEIVKDETYFIENRKAILALREKIQQELKQLNIWYNPSHANFLFLKAPHGCSGLDFHEKTGIFIRDCSSFGLKGYWRVSCGSKKEMNFFMEELSNILFQNPK